MVIESVTPTVRLLANWVTCPPCGTALERCGVSFTYVAVPSVSRRVNVPPSVLTSAIDHLFRAFVSLWLGPMARVRSRLQTPYHSRDTKKPTCHSTLLEQTPHGGRSESLFRFPYDPSSKKPMKNRRSPFCPRFSSFPPRNGKGITLPGEPSPSTGLLGSKIG